MPVLNEKLRAVVLSHGLMRPLRGSGFAFGQPDAFGAGIFPLRRMRNASRWAFAVHGKLLDGLTAYQYDTAYAKAA